MCNFHYLGYYCSPNLSIYQNSTQELTWNFLVTLALVVTLSACFRFCIVCIVDCFCKGQGPSKHMHPSTVQSYTSQKVIYGVLNFSKNPTKNFILRIFSLGNAQDLDFLFVYRNLQTFNAPSTINPE